MIFASSEVTYAVGMHIVVESLDATWSPFVLVAGLLCHRSRGLGGRAFFDSWGRDAR